MAHRSVAEPEYQVLVVHKRSDVLNQRQKILMSIPRTDFIAWDAEMASLQAEKNDLLQTIRRLRFLGGLSLESYNFLNSVEHYVSNFFEQRAPQ